MEGDEAGVRENVENTVNYGICPELGVENKGSWRRIKKVMKKGEQGEPLTVAFIGGSITQGSLASSLEKTYSYQVFKWWKEKFPKSGAAYLNGGIGGTDSQFGAARVKNHILKQNPDFIVVEFSVNDKNTSHFKETFEGLIRQIYKSPSEPAILIVNNVFYDTGENAQHQHNAIGKAYGIPCISMKGAVYPKVADGTVKAEKITPDHLHPNDEGHRLVAFVITDFLEKVYRERKTAEASYSMPGPVTKNRYEYSVRLQNWYDEVEMEGFGPDIGESASQNPIFKNGWTAEQEGDFIRFHTKGSSLAVQYLKSIHKPLPKAIAIVDGKEENAVLLDGNFEETWGDCLYLQTLLEQEEADFHTVEIRIVESHKEDTAPFKLVSFIVSDACPVELSVIASSLG